MEVLDEMPPQRVYCQKIRSAGLPKQEMGGICRGFLAWGSQPRIWNRKSRGNHQNRVKAATFLRR
jgi:hypothetical protein